MKDSIALTLLITVLGTTAATAHAHSAPEPERLVVQLGSLAITEHSLYAGASTQHQLFPLLLVGYGRFYFHGAQGGYRFMQRGSTSIALQFGINSDGYKASDSEVMEGMRARRDAVESGLLITHRLKPGHLEFSLMNDLGSTHKGYSARIAYEHLPMMTIAGATSFYLAGEYYDSAKSDYYFGVDEHEATPGRAAHTIGGVSAFSAGLRHAYPVSARLTLLGSIGYRAFEKKLALSPIVQRNGQMQAHAAFAYRF